MSPDVVVYSISPSVPSSTFSASNVLTSPEGALENQLLGSCAGYINDSAILVLVDGLELCTYISSYDSYAPLGDLVVYTF